MIDIVRTRTASHLLCRLPELDVADAAAFLIGLGREPSFLRAHVFPFVQPSAQSPEPFIARTFGTRESSNCLQVFVWPSGAATPIHDHTSWGAYHCVIGLLCEDRYLRLDVEQQPSTARLRKQWRQAWSKADGASMVGAYEHGIHRVANGSARLAVSLHLYGPRIGMYDGRDYDPSRDFVCDRLELDEMVSGNNERRKPNPRAATVRGSS